MSERTGSVRDNHKSVGAEQKIGGDCILDGTIFMNKAKMGTSLLSINMSSY